MIINLLKNHLQPKLTWFHLSYPYCLFSVFDLSLFWYLLPGTKLSLVCAWVRLKKEGSLQKNAFF